MTIKEEFELFGENHGLWPDETAAVIELLPESLRKILNDRFSEYRECALGYLRDAKPKHFAIGLLEAH